MDNNEAMQALNKLIEQDHAVPKGGMTLGIISDRLNHRYKNGFIDGWQAAQQQSAGEIAELKADNERLREALEKAYEKLKLHVSGTREYVGGTPTQILFPLIEQVLSATPSQSLQAHDNSNKTMAGACGGQAGSFRALKGKQ